MRTQCQKKGGSLLSGLSELFSCPLSLLTRGPPDPGASVAAGAACRPQTWGRFFLLLPFRHAHLLPSKTTPYGSQKAWGAAGVGAAVPSPTVSLVLHTISPLHCTYNKSIPATPLKA